MPRIKRWFPVSHDINRDAELWGLREQYGEKVLACWLELLSIADRNEGVIPGDLESIAGTVAWAIRCKTTRVVMMINSITTLRWLHINDKITVTNYAKYHRTWEHSTFPPDLTRANLIKKEDTTYLPKKKNRTPFPDDFQVSDSVRVWCVTEYGISDPEPELQAFRDYHKSKGSAFLDWQAAFRTWMRNREKFGRNGKGGKEQAEGELSERTKRILRRGL